MNTVSDIVVSFKNRDKEALVFKSGFRSFRYSYKEVFKKIKQTQSLLAELKIRKGDAILLWGYNGPEWAIVYLAAADLGVVIVPIDYLATHDFVEKIQSEVKAKVLFRSEFKISTLKIPQITLEYLDQKIQKLPSNSGKNGIKPSDLLEIVYTSGTTGDPKGVMITNENIISNVRSVIKMAGVSPEQRFLSLLPLSHLFEQNPGFLSPLAEGCTIIYIRGLRPQLIFKTLKDEKITNMITVPRILKLLADGILREAESQGKIKIFNMLLQIKAKRSIKKLLFFSVHKKFGQQFQYFVAGGATLPPELETFWNNLGFTIVQGYGMTECSPVIIANTPLHQTPGSIGREVEGIKIKISEYGEILAKGKSVTAGYYKNAQKTKDLFTPDGWLRTGDVGEKREDGNYFLKGRQKDIIVTSAGVNVYPEDIEQLILKNSAVKDVCVLGVPADNGELVHAEILLKSKADIRKIIEVANESLNDAQKIMSFGKWLDDDFPRTTTMKIKKRFVLEKIQNRKNTSKADNNTSYSKLYTILATIAQMSPGEIRSTSILSTDLKMTSINRVELISMIETEFNLDVSEEDITADTKVKDLEEVIKLRKRVIEKDIYHRSLLSMPMRIVRGVYNYVLTDMMIRFFCRRKVLGVENLSGFDGPAIFIANHVGYFDAPNVLMSLPFHIRHKIATAAWKEYFDIPKRQIFKKALYYFYYIHASFFTNIYLLPKEKGFKPAFEYTGELLDKGWNILLFPEGEHSKSGKLQTFRPGIGLLAREMRVPIVPIKHEGLERIMAGDEHQIPRFGKVTIKIGKPVYPDYSKSIPEIVNEMHKIIEQM